MPFNETTVMDERCQFVTAYNSGFYSMTELCTLHGISRPTGYKWLQRYARFGPAGLHERSRAPHSCPHRIDPHAAKWLLQQRRSHPTWGPRKLRICYQRACLAQPAPSRSAIARLLKREGLISARKPRKPRRAQRSRPLRVYQPHDLWTIDFKGQFLTGDHLWCYPLTLMDHASRFLLACHAQLDTNGTEVKHLMLALFKQYGLPRAILSDNGAPFSSIGLAGLSSLSVQWMKLGIRIHHSRPACPQDNAAHERMHRTLKADTTRPPAANLPAQQRSFDRFRRCYNFQRPHETLHDQVPATLFTPSPRPYPSHIQQPSYPGHFQVRRVDTAGALKWHGSSLFIGKALRTEILGFQEIDNGIWSIYFFNHLLARFNEQSMQLIEPPHPNL